MVVVGVPCDYFVSTQLQLWLFCCWGCGCCLAVTIMESGLSGTHLISITNLGLNLNVAATDVILNKGTSTIHFSEVSKL